MISQEPTINVGIVEGAREIQGAFEGTFMLPTNTRITGRFSTKMDDGMIVLFDARAAERVRGRKIRAVSLGDSTFVLQNVTIGIKFHWERKEDEKFEGDLVLVLGQDGTITAINEVPLEKYLESVVSSEMSAEAPVELLRAHAITSRSWLVAMLEREQKNFGLPSQRTLRRGDEVIRWYDREDHELFDVCADDHCQRYHGITKIISPAAREAVRSTRGTFLVYEEKICDARYFKACGGRTEDFATAWENTRIPYLTSVSDSETAHPPVRSEEDAERWIRSRPEAFCNTTDKAILRQILPDYDQETKDFFRWRVEYRQQRMAELLLQKSGIDFGTIMNIIPLNRGPSGRIYRLRIEGSARTVVVGKELEIRRWLSKSHLYSAAFIVEAVRDSSGVPEKFIFHGAGWGHGVGLCQIGAAIMAARGRMAGNIVRHYFPGAEVKKLY